MFGVNVEATLISPISAAAIAASAGVKREMFCLIRVNVTRRLIVASAENAAPQTAV